MKGDLDEGDQSTFKCLHNVLVYGISAGLPSDVLSYLNNIPSMNAGCGVTYGERTHACQISPLFSVYRNVRFIVLPFLESISLDLLI